MATAEDGGKNALHVRVDIGSLEVTSPQPSPRDAFLHLLYPETEDSAT